MEPQNQSTSTNTQANNPSPVLPPTTSPSKIPFYRSYWIFGAIYLILPPIIGLIILLTGDIYRKQKDGTDKPISKREKVTLTVVAILFWSYLVFKNLNHS